MANHSKAKFVWYDLMTTDMAAAETFYGAVVGWSAADSGMADRPYTLFSKGTEMIAGLMPIPTDAAGAPPTWMGYIGVDDVDGYTAKVRAAGGAVRREATDIPGIGRFAVVTDPDGAYFILFKGNVQAPPAHDTNEAGRVGWNELHAGDWEKAWEFYSGLFGWTKEIAVDMGPMGTYQTFETGGAGGGMMTRMPETPAPFWLYYFNVDSVEAAVERINKAGGKVLAGPHEVPGGAWIVQGFDPQGAIFAVTSRTK